MSVTDYFVLICFVVGSLSAALVAFHPNVLYAAVALIFSLLSVAGLYAAMGADFLAAVQLIIYVGGIIVVVLFALMMSKDVYRARFAEGAKAFLFPFLLSAFLLTGLLRLLHATDWPQQVVPEREATAEAIGRALVGPYALIFEYIAVVLLAGLVGAVVVARPLVHKSTKQKDEVRDEL